MSIVTSLSPLYVWILNFLTAKMMTMWYDKIVVIIIILFRVKNIIEIETHNYLL